MLHRLFLVYQPNIVAEAMTSVMHKCYVLKMENVQNIRRVMLSLQTIRFFKYYLERCRGLASCQISKLL